jgi:hypothetical protein
MISNIVFTRDALSSSILGFLLTLYFFNKNYNS